MNIFTEISIILVIATTVAGIMHLLRQPLIIGHMQSLLRTEEIPFIDKMTLSEMKTYIRKQNGGMEASAGNNDDRVVSICGAYFVLKQNPYRPPAKKAKAKAISVRKFKQFRSGGLRKRWRHYP